jgi:hypothetical protein
VGEYGPLIGNMLLWFQIVAHLGARSAAVLMAANLCILAAFGLTGIVTLPSVRRRRGAKREVWRATLRRAWFAEALAMLAGVTALAAILATYASLGRNEIILLALVQAMGLPARYSGPAREAVRFHQGYRLFRAWSGVVLIAAMNLIDWGPLMAAAALAGREWIALLGLILLPHRDRPRRRIPWEGMLTLEELGGVTARSNLRRTSYHLGKSLLSILIGPLGGFIARTGRGMRIGLNSRYALPSAYLVRLIALVAPMVGLVVAAIVKGPGALILSAALLRIGSVALSASFWAVVARNNLASAPEDDDDE